MKIPISAVSEEIDDFLPNLCGYLLSTNDACDTFLIFCPKEPVLGISLAPDQKQTSETKAMIAETISRLQEIRNDDKITHTDLEFTSQNAYLQMLEKGSSFDFLHNEPDLYTLEDGEPI